MRPTYSNTYLKSFGWNDAATTATDFAFYGGRIERADGTSVLIPPGTVALVNGTNYVELDFAAQKVTVNQVGWTAGRRRLWEVSKAGSSINAADRRADVLEPPTTAPGGAVNSGLPSLATYKTASGLNDSGWGGTKTTCYVDSLTGYLYPNASKTFADVTGWTGTFDPGWAASFTYRTQTIDLGGLLETDGAFTVAGNFTAGNPVITMEASQNGTDWNPVVGTQAGLTLTFPRVTARYFRFTIVTAQQVGNVNPSYLSGFSYTFKGPQYGEGDYTDVPVGGKTITFQRFYPRPPAFKASPTFNAQQDVKVRYSQLTATSVFVELVLDDGTNTSMNGFISYDVLSR